MLATSPLCHLLDQRAYRPVPCAFQSTCADMVGCARLCCIRNFVQAIPQAYCLSSRKSPVCLPANILFVIQVSVRSHRGRSLHANCRRRGLPRAMSSSSDAFTGLLPIYATLLGHRGNMASQRTHMEFDPRFAAGKDSGSKFQRKFVNAWCMLPQSPWAAAAVRSHTGISWAFSGTPTQWDSCLTYITFSPGGYPVSSSAIVLQFIGKSFFFFFGEPAPFFRVPLLMRFSVSGFFLYLLRL